MPRNADITSHNAEDILRAHFPQYRREAEERDRLEAEAKLHQQLLAASGKIELGLGTTVRGPDMTVQSPQNTVRTPEISPCEGVPLHGAFASEIRVDTNRLTQRAPVSRDFWQLASPGFEPTVRLLDKEDLDNSCTVQNERSLVHDTAIADEGNLLSATSFEDNRAARSPARHAAKETSSPRQLEEEEITTSTPAPAAHTGTTYLSQREFADKARIDRIRCQLYDNDKLGSKSKQRSRLIVKITVYYKGGRSDIWYLRLLSEKRYFWRKTTKANMSEVEAELVSTLDELNTEIKQSGSKPTISPCIGHIFDNHEPIKDCVGLLAQDENDMPGVLLLLRGTWFGIAIDQPSKGSKSLASDCGIGYWHPRHKK